MEMTTTKENRKRTTILTTEPGLKKLKLLAAYHGVSVTKMLLELVDRAWGEVTAFNGIDI